MLNQPELSVVISCYYEEKTVEEFHQRLFCDAAEIDGGVL